MHEIIERYFREIIPNVEFISLRLIQERTENLSVRQNILQPVSTNLDVGAMISVIHQGGLGYAGTSDLTKAGLLQAIKSAQKWAQVCSERGITHFDSTAMPHEVNHYTTPVVSDWSTTSLNDKIALLMI